MLPDNGMYGAPSSAWRVQPESGVLFPVLFYNSSHSSLPFVSVPTKESSLRTTSPADGMYGVVVAVISSSGSGSGSLSAGAAATAALEPPPPPPRNPPGPTGMGTVLYTGFPAGSGASAAATAALALTSSLAILMFSRTSAYESPVGFGDGSDIPTFLGM